MKNTLIAAFMLVVMSAAAQQQHTVSSPDGRIVVTIDAGDKLYVSVRHERTEILRPSPFVVRVEDGAHLGVSPVVRNARKRDVRTTIPSPLYKRAVVKDEFNELTLAFRGDYSLVVRAYSDGVAYRFLTTRRKSFVVTAEESAFVFAGNHTTYVPYVNKPAGTPIEEQLWNSFENTYTRAPLSELDKSRLAFLPVLVDVGDGKKVCVTEADLESYPGMYVINRGSEHTLSTYFAAHPRRTEQGGHNELQQLVREREPWLLRAQGTRSFPWRVLAISVSDEQLADSDLVYRLASPSRVADLSWIRPGKVAWDWWNDWNVYGVDFRSGINTETYKRYIDFASANKLEYVILDEGWAVNKAADLMKIVPAIDLPAIVSYATAKNVGIILWAGYHAFDRDMENVCRHYAALGVKGFKIDFMDRDDKPMVDFYYNAAATAAKYRLLVDFHGAYKPTGLNRTYPNVINFEGVHGLEQMKWSPPEVDQVTYDVTIPFIRMVAGPMDYTQGALRNAIRKNYRPIYSEPMSQGTRCRQLGQYVIFEAPLNMLCDSPTEYEKEPETTAFIAQVPTVWDETVALAGKVGEYVAIARRKGDVWYIGALTNWTERELDLNLSFLPAGSYTAEVFEDGLNASRVASDFRRSSRALSPGDVLKVRMAPGGGFVARLAAK